MAGVIGALYGLLILVGLDFVVTAFSYLPYNFLDALGSVSKYVTVAFAIFPALAVAYQHGFKKGAITAGIVVAVYFLIKKFGVITLGEGVSIALNGEGMAMLAGTIAMLAFAASVKGEAGTANTDLVNVFSEKVAKIRKNWFLLAIMGGLLACGTSMAMIAGDPISLALVSNGAISEAAMAAAARAIGFIPLVFTTAIVTGVYGPAGCTFVFVMVCYSLIIH